MAYITANCIISKQAVYKNGKLVYPPTPAGAPADLLSALYTHFDWQYAKYFRMDNLSRLGFAAAEILLQGWDSSAYRQEEIAIVLSNANSSLDTDYRYTETTRDIPSPGVFVYTLPNIMVGEISIRHHLKGENAFFLSDTFNPDLLMKYVGYLLTQKIAGVCITGWVELLGDSCKAALFLIEEKANPGAPLFSAENLDRIFKNGTT